MIVRRAGLGSSMSRYLIDRIEAAKNIEVITETEVTAVHGAETVESVSLRDRAGSVRRVNATAVFVMIGAVPCSEAAVGMLALDPAGYLLCGDAAADSDGRLSWPLKDRPPHLLETVRPGVFAAGDVRAGALNRVASAVGDGALAVRFVHDVLDA
jgi:thioredoxin reductase (NADPH)